MANRRATMSLVDVSRLRERMVDDFFQLRGIIVSSLRNPYHNSPRPSVVHVMDSRRLGAYTLNTRHLPLWVSIALFYWDPGDSNLFGAEPVPLALGHECHHARLVRPDVDVTLTRTESIVQQLGVQALPYNINKVQVKLRGGVSGSNGRFSQAHPSQDRSHCSC